MRLGQNLEKACNSMLEMVEPLGGRGGVIAIDSKGNIELPFQTMLMYRGSYQNGEIFTAIGP
jgi:beta-aspartyl-peptidase (threonine type)